MKRRGSMDSDNSYGSNDNQFQEQQQQPSREEEPTVEIQQTETTGVDIQSLIKSITLEMAPREKIIKQSIDKHLNIPVALRVQTERKKNHEDKVKSSTDRAGIDLVCVVDVSGSMQGQKLDLVKNSLRYIMKILGPQDRIALVDFHTRASVLFPFLRNTPENKEYLKSTILKLSSKGSTNINHGLELGLELIEKRKYKNPVTCLFLLSDGQDDNTSTAIDRIDKTLRKYKTIKETFTINTFGYGSDHDASLMNAIATQKKGNFYYIENVNSASEYFVLSMSGMLSIAAEKIQITLQQIRRSEGFVVNKVFGEGILWQRDKQDNLQINLNYLLMGEQKEYIFEITVPKKQQFQIMDEQRQQVVLTVTLEGQTVQTQEKLQKTSELCLTFLNENEEYVPQIDDDVEVSYLRTKAGEIIGFACNLAEQGNYEQAQSALNEVKLEIQDSEFRDCLALKTVLQDVERSLSSCKPQEFKTSGKAFLLKKTRNHMQRQASYENLLDWNEDQRSVMGDMQNGNLCLSNVDMNDDYQNDEELNQLPGIVNRIRIDSAIHSPQQDSPVDSPKSSNQQNAPALIFQTSNLSEGVEEQAQVVPVLKSSLKLEKQNE